MDELVAGADAVGREAVSELCRVVLGTPPALATFGTLQALGPLRLVLAPFPTPFEVLYRCRQPLNVFLLLLPGAAVVCIVQQAENTEYGSQEAVSAVMHNLYHVTDCTLHGLHV